MSLLKEASKGVTPTSHMNLLYAESGVGKTFFVAKVPGVFFADIEGGSSSVDVTRLGPDKLNTYESLAKLVADFTVNAEGFKALAIDSVTTLEFLIKKSVCDENQVKELGELAFGRGTELAKLRLKEFMASLRRLKDSGVEIWLIGHARQKKYTDPTMQSTIDRYTLQINDGFAEIIKQECDNVFFCKQDLSISIDKNTKKAKGASDGTRTMYTRWQAGFDAKNRINLPPELPMDYEEYCKAIDSYAPKSVDDLKKDIESLMAITKLQNPELAKIAFEKMQQAGDSNEKLQRIKEKLLNETTGLAA